MNLIKNFNNMGLKHGFPSGKPYSQRIFQHFVTEKSSALSFHPY